MRTYHRPLGLLLFILFWIPALGAQTPIGGSLANTELRSFLKENYYIVTSLGYNTARDRMFGNIDPVNGRIVCVYTGYSKTGTTRSEMNSTSNGVMINTEHTWPQSLFNEANPMVSDLHHLYPTWERVNGARSNYPFAQLDDNISSTWYGGSYLNSIQTTTKPGPSVILDYSQYAGNKFEPRADHRGNVARTMFYFWTMYSTNSSITAQSSANTNFFNGMKDVLYKWHREDPVDSKELARTHAIASYQGKPNPFVLDSTLVRRAYFFVPTSIEPEQELPKEFAVSSAYPNPFNPMTSVELTMNVTSNVSAILYDSMGRQAKVISSGMRPAGMHTLIVDGSGLASGVYFLRVLTSTHMDVVPLLLVK